MGQPILTVSISDRCSQVFLFKLNNFKFDFDFFNPNLNRFFIIRIKPKQFLNTNSNQNDLTKLTELMMSHRNDHFTPKFWKILPIHTKI